MWMNDIKNDGSKVFFLPLRKKPHCPKYFFFNSLENSNFFIKNSRFFPLFSTTKNRWERSEEFKLKNTPTFSHPKISFPPIVLFQVGKIDGKGGYQIQLSYLKIRVGEILPLKKVGKGFFVQIFLIGEI
jgi:hypothetical protein